MKANNAKDAKKLTDIPNVGEAVARDLRRIGITAPLQLKGKDGLKLYHKLNKVTSMRHDPCMADVLMAVVDFMNGGAPKPWFAFTSRRKKLLRL